jgi:hypothetical protein
MSFVCVCNNTAMIVLRPNLARMVSTVPAVREERNVLSEGCSPRQWKPFTHSQPTSNKIHHNSLVSGAGAEQKMPQ